MPSWRVYRDRGTTLTYPKPGSTPKPNDKTNCNWPRKAEEANAMYIILEGSAVLHCRTEQMRAQIAKEEVQSRRMPSLALVLA